MTCMYRDLAGIMVVASVALTSTAANGQGQREDGGLAGGACAGDINSSGAVDVDDLLMVINGWGACAAPCPPICAADVDGNCAVNVNDLLAVVNTWGPCPCIPDTAEPNQSCAASRTLIGVQGGCNQPGSAATHSTFNLTPVGDADYYRFYASENCDCPCNLTVTVTLTVPPSAGTSYSLSVRRAGCTATGQDMQSLPSIAPGAIGTLSLTWQDSWWGADDSAWIYLEIAQNAPQVLHCAPYTLTYHLTEG